MLFFLYYDAIFELRRISNTLGDGLVILQPLFCYYNNSGLLFHVLTSFILSSFIRPPIHSELIRTSSIVVFILVLQENNSYISGIQLIEID